MNWANSAAGLSALRATRTAHDRGYAEMGAAFGLEANLFDSPDDSAPSWRPVDAPIIAAWCGARGSEPIEPRRSAGAAGHFGISTVSITWITPLSAVMSAFVTLALSTVTPPAVASVSSDP